MSAAVEIAVGQCWSTPSGLITTIHIVRRAVSFDDAWVVTSSNSNSAACLSTDYILRYYWLMEREPVTPG